MKFGLCTGLENINMLEEFRFNYIEPALNVIEALTDNEFNEVKKKVSNSSLKAEVFNCFIPKDIKLVGKNIDYKKIKEYILRSIDRASQLSGEVIVFGSGKSRSVPEGYSKDSAYEQLIEFLILTADIASSYGITIAIEPLRIEESNIINTVHEALELSKKINRPGIRVLADYYHMECQNEKADIIISAGTEYLEHVHIANAKGRLFPKLADSSDYSAIFLALKSIGYNKRISIEGKSVDLRNDLMDSMKMFQSFFKEF